MWLRNTNNSLSKIIYQIWFLLNIDWVWAYRTCIRQPFHPFKENSFDRAQRHTKWDDEGPCYKEGGEKVRKRHIKKEPSLRSLPCRGEETRARRVRGDNWVPSSRHFVLFCTKLFRVCCYDQACAFNVSAGPAPVSELDERGSYHRGELSWSWGMGWEGLLHQL